MRTRRQRVSERVWTLRWKLLSWWIVIFTGAVGYVLYQIDVAPRHNCERISKQIVNAVAPDADKLGEPGTAGYAYYRVHPDELQVAREQAKNLKNRFDPKLCK